MKVLLLALLIPSLIGSAVAWTKEDYEIFDLVSDLQSAEGKGTTFYSFLDVPSTASSSEIGRAYRRKSLELHPDKNPGVKGIHERFARLGTISQILRDPAQRERYDFFYKNGVPTWRGTGYYYSRYRPGLISVAVFLALVTSLVQYIVQGMNYSRELAQVRRITSQARIMAWGSKGTPIEGERKLRVPLSDEPGAKGVDVLVSGDQVFLLGDDKAETVPLDDSTPLKPAVSRTWLVSLVLSAVKPIIEQLRSSSLLASKVSEETEESDASATPTANGSTVRKPTAAAASMAGGRRRKAVKPVKRKPKEEPAAEAPAS